MIGTKEQQEVRLSLLPQPYTRLDSLRILAIAPTSFFSDYGCHVRILGQIRLLQEHGHNVHLCTYHTGKDVPDLPIRRTRSLPWRHGPEIGSSLHKIPYDLLLSTSAFREALRLRPHLIQAYLHEATFMALPISRLLGVPILFDLQGSLTGEMIDHDFIQRGGCVYRSLRWLERSINHWPTMITVSSHHTADVLRNDPRIAPSDVRVVCDWVDGAEFRPDLLSAVERWTLLRELGIPGHRRIVVYLGLLAEHQGIPSLLRAAAHLRARWPDVHFLIMGYPRVDRYRRLARQVGVADIVTFPGRIPYAEAPRYLALGEVAVAPKQSATEGSGKLPNYMAMALPTVAFDTPVSREVLGPSGCYAPPGDAQGLAELIEHLLLDPQEAQARGRALRRRALLLHSREVAQDQLEAAYTQALAEDGRG